MVSPDRETYTRRRFVATSVLAAGAVPMMTRQAFSATPMTAQDVVMTIRQHLNMTWDEKSYRDTFKMGDPNTQVRGIACCFMSTLDVLQRCKRQGLNFVISHEPTIWSDPDLVEPVQDDPLYREKKRYVDDNGMVIWRLHDHWHRMKPEPMMVGYEVALGWEKYGEGDRGKIYRIPKTTLQELAVHMAKSLKTRSVRMIGNPSMPVETVCFGGHDLGSNIRVFEKADVVFPPEAREFDSIEYARDLSALMPDKGMITIAHESAEEYGFSMFPKWLEPLVPGIPLKYVATTDRMWLA